MTVRLHPWLLVLLLLAACTTASTPTVPPPPPTPAPTATAMPTSVAPSPTASPLSTPAATPSPSPTPSSTLATPQSRSVRADIGGHAFLLEVADTPEERGRGLMGRPSLPRDGGMLFVFDDEAPWTFWMKDTLIPLDILFLDGGGRVVDVQTMEPEPGVSDNALRRYTSRRPARYAIEVNAGLAAELGIAVGTQVRWER